MCILSTVRYLGELSRLFEQIKVTNIDECGSRKLNICVVVLVFSNFRYLISFIGRKNRLFSFFQKEYKLA